MNRLAVSFGRDVMPTSVANIADAGCEHFAEDDFDGLGLSSMLSNCSREYLSGFRRGGRGQSPKRCRARPHAAARD